MRHHNTVFHDLTKHIPWNQFDRLVAVHGSDHRVRRLSCKSQFLALLYGQISGAQSLREIEAGLASHKARLYHLGAQEVARSTLSDANSTRPSALFEELFAHMARRAGRSLRRHLRDGMRILDATRIELSPLCGGWAKGAKSVRSIKVHVVYDPDVQAPVTALTSGPLVNDITPAKSLEIESGATYVFDLGYYSFDWWARLHAQDCRFVTRLKRHTSLRGTQPNPVADGPDADHILADQTGFLPLPHGRDLSDPVREITVKIATGKVLRLITNDLNSTATEIAQLYKMRWQVELFFKWIKQKLKLSKFLGRSENAVRTQIFTALIAHLLLCLAHASQTVVPRLATFVRLVSLNLMHRRPITRLTEPPPPDIKPGQTEMAWL